MPPCCQSLASAFGIVCCQHNLHNVITTATWSAGVPQEPHHGVEAARHQAGGAADAVHAEKVVRLPPAYRPWGHSLGARSPTTTCGVDVLGAASTAATVAASH